MTRATTASPAVTGLMIVKDREPVIGAAVASVLAQGSGDWELIVVDAGAREGTVVAAGAAAAGDDRVRVVRNQGSPGIPGARNHGLASARGRYLAICDSDDLSRPQRFAVESAALDGDARLGGVGGLISIFASDPDTGRVPDWRWGVPRGRPPFPFPAAMFRVAALRQVGGFDETYPVAEDVTLAFDLAAAGWGLELLPEVLVDYRRSGDATHGNPRRHRLTLRAQLHGVRVLRGRFAPSGYAAIAQSAWRAGRETYRSRFSTATAR
ncbi:MAG: glycosyltransferase family A protein [Candidatus Nanopelagicales bacterium]